MMAKKSAIPEVLGVPKLPRTTPQINGNSTSDTFIYDRRPPWPGCFLQTGESIFFKAAHPILNGARSMAKNFGNLSTTESRADEQNTVKPVIIAPCVRIVVASR
jgi:hypothetical protein